MTFEHYAETALIEHSRLQRLAFNRHAKDTTMHRQAITTRYLGPTNHRGARIKAQASAGSLVVSWDHALNSSDNHALAAQALARKLEWKGVWFSGGMPDDRGDVFVMADAREPAFYSDDITKS